MKSASSSLRRVLLSPAFSDFYIDNGCIDMMDEDVVSDLSVRVKLTLTVWDFILPVTPSLPAVIGVSWNQISFMSLVHVYGGGSVPGPLRITSLFEFLSKLPSVCSAFF